ncbi:MAG: DegQ family serine endoprotease [Planctomycetes bacterium]|nr:DegQ family serine endoprotease [Planctomycetota bacterium]
MKVSNVRICRKNTHYFVISVVFVLAMGIFSVPAIGQDTESISALRQMGKAFSSIAEKTSPAVVWITAEKTIPRGGGRRSPFGDGMDPFDDDFFDFFFGRPSPKRQRPRKEKERKQTAMGSGFIVSPDGYVLTNNHVVEDATEITVRLADDREFKAELVGTDPASEVAVLKIVNDEDFTILELADSDELEVGEWVLAIGNPFGLSHTVTAGIVSAKGRSGLGLAEYENFIQTDAAINRGNSGGPLINLDGKVVGINTAIIGAQGNVGIGLAVPINMAKNVYEQLVDSGKVVRGFMGVVIQDLTPKLAKSFDLDENTKGVLIPKVSKDSAAEKAGMKKGDIVVELDGKAVDKANTFRQKVSMLKPGTKVDVVVLRDGKRKTITIELGERPSKEVASAVESKILDKLGISVQNLTKELAENMGYEDAEGVVVTEVEPGSKAESAGINRGTLIIEVNRKAVKNTKAFKKAIEPAIKKGSVVLLLYNGRSSWYVVLEFPKE